MFESKSKARSICQKIKLQRPKDHFSSALTAILLFDFLDDMLKDGYKKDWLDNFEKFSEEYLTAIKFIEGKLDLNGNSQNEEKLICGIDEDVKYKTGEVYYELWKDFDKKEYYQNTLAILSERFAKNGILDTNYNHVLDDGCGSGRYSLALKEMKGVIKVTGVDISHNSIEFANKMKASKASVEFKQGSVLELPFKDETFDFVFSNGVLHHTTDTIKGLKEIYRVLQKGGKCWLYLYGGKGSFFWDIVSLCRDLLKDVEEEYTIMLMKLLGYSPGRIFHRNDFFYVPIHNRYYEDEVIDMLSSVGFTNFERLKRGVEFDWDEIIYRYPNIDPYIYGEGEMRFLLQK
jgi:ubiquinone/menaquinone biosynthesis C-methylase UbiE